MVHFEKSLAHCKEHCNQNKDVSFSTARFFGGAGRNDREENNKENSGRALSLGKSLECGKLFKK